MPSVAAKSLSIKLKRGATTRRAFAASGSLPRIGPLKRRPGLKPGAGEGIWNRGRWPTHEEKHPMSLIQARVSTDNRVGSPLARAAVPLCALCMQCVRSPGDSYTGANTRRPNAMATSSTGLLVPADAVIRSYMGWRKLFVTLHAM